MRSALRPLLLGALLLTVTFAGCLEFRSDGDVPPSAVRKSGAPKTDPPVAGTMTAQERGRNISGRVDTSGNCGDPGLVPISSRSPSYCAVRTVWLQGSMELALLPIDLAAFNGPIIIQPGASGWNLTVKISAFADDTQTAVNRLHNIDFTWTHSDGRGHFLHAAARPKPNTDHQNTQAGMTLTLPTGIVVSGNAVTSNDNIGINGFSCKSLLLTTSNDAITADFAGHECPWIVATTSNSDITIAGGVKDAELTTSNSKIVADLVPIGSGTWTLTTSNSQVGLKVPEAADKGYSLDATTSNGDITIGLRDGSLTSDTAHHKHFNTQDYARRAVRTSVTITTSNDDVTVNPA